MKIKEDKRHYYIKGLLRQLKVSPFDFKGDELVVTLSHRYRLPYCKQDEEIIASRNGVIDKTIQYITDLEAEVERLQYVARIIEMAKEN